MKFTIRPRNDQRNGAFSVLVEDPRTALDVAKGMVERGIPNVEILDHDGIALDLAELERIAEESD